MRREQIEAFIIEKSSAGWWILDWDYEGYEKDVAGPFKTRSEAVNKAIDLSYS